MRLEDNVIVTADGIENMSSVPRAIEEVRIHFLSSDKLKFPFSNERTDFACKYKVESVMAGGTWPPTRDQLPSLRRDFTSWTRE